MNNNNQNSKKEADELITNSNTNTKSNTTPEQNEENKTNNNDNNNNKNDKKKISFNEIKIVVKYYQNDYIKKAFIYSNNDFKKIKHKYLSTQDHIKNLKKQNNIKSILLHKEANQTQTQTKTNNKENLNLALLKLNELISEVNTDNDEQEQEPDVPNQMTKDEGEKIPFIKKNIKFIKRIEELNKMGVNYRCLSKSEIKLLKKKNKNICNKFQNNPQNFFSEKLCDNVTKSFEHNKDDNDLVKNNNKNMLININDIENIKKISRNNSYKEEKRK
jgi:hypothetical protein